MAAGIVDVDFNGLGLMSDGFVTSPDDLSSTTTIFSGIAILTFGFLWPVSDIWIPCDDPITTTWTVCP